MKWFVFFFLWIFLSHLCHKIFPKSYFALKRKKSSIKSTVAPVIMLFSHHYPSEISAHLQYKIHANSSPELLIISRLLYHLLHLCFRGKKIWLLVRKQSRLSTFLKTLYLELALKEPPVPGWAQPVAPGALSAARLEPELRLHMQSHGTNEIISVDQLLMPIQVSFLPSLNPWCFL